jgi:hypothetical protein
MTFVVETAIKNMKGGAEQWVWMLDLAGEQQDVACIVIHCNRCSTLPGVEKSSRSLQEAHQGLQEQLDWRLAGIWCAVCVHVLHCMAAVGVDAGPGR